MKSDDCIDELLMSYLFPPSDDVAGMVLAKRYMAENKHFDVIQANIKKDNDLEFERCVNKYINERILIDMNNCNPNLPECIFEFIDKSMRELEKKDEYKRISTIVWKIANNFLGFEYKLRHPDVYWITEFTDPLLFSIYNKRLDTGKAKNIEDEGYINKINNAISELNKSENADFEMVGENTNVHFLVEYIAYLFADEIVFTNENQREMMLTQFPVDIRDFVMKKSTVKAHPTLAEKYYHVKNYDENLDSSKINIGYFGNIYSKRHFEIVYHAFEVLNHKHKDKLQFYFYVYEKNFLKQLTEGLSISNNIHIKDPLDYLNYLNLTTKLDVLIVNDLITSDCFKQNPYLPSKLSDYIGSGTDIWAIFEKGSSLERCNVKYKSDIKDLKSNVEVMVNILDDYSFADENYTVADSYDYLQNRLTRLNIIIDEEHKRLKNAKRETKKLKNENSILKKHKSSIESEKEEILSSNSWKITRSFRKIGNVIKK